MERNENFVLENAKLPNISAGEYAEQISRYIDKDGRMCVIPPGWTVSGIESENTIWYRGFDKEVSVVIYRIPKKQVNNCDWSDIDLVEALRESYDQFVWTYVRALPLDATLDGNSFTERFGRENFRSERFFEKNFYEPAIGELALQVRSVEKYGGFFISRYNISKDKVSGKPQSMKYKKPWTKIPRYQAKKVAKMMVASDIVTSHMVFGAEYDTVLRTFYESMSKNFTKIASDSNSWGNFAQNEYSLRKRMRTGEDERWCVNNIYDFAGNISEWTQETNRNLTKAVTRGGDALQDGKIYPVSTRAYANANLRHPFLGFRTSLCIE